MTLIISINRRLRKIGEPNVAINAFRVGLLRLGTKCEGEKPELDFSRMIITSGQLTINASAVLPHYIEF